MNEEQRQSAHQTLMELTSIETRLQDVQDTLASLRLRLQRTSMQLAEELHGIPKQLDLDSWALSQLTRNNGDENGKA